MQHRFLQSLVAQNFGLFIYLHLRYLHKGLYAREVIKGH